jgi:hypothetical protein
MAHPPATPNRARQFLARRLTALFPFLVPPLYLGLVLWLEPADRFGPPDNAAWLARWLYDDYDVTAMALRGLNAARGRTPGRLDQPPRVGADTLASAVDRPGTLRPRYFLEYPHAALLLFWLPYLSGEDVRTLDVHPAIADAHHGDVAEFEPETDSERRLWRQFRRAARFYETCMTACLLLLMAVLRAGYGPDLPGPGPVWLLLLPGSLYFTLNRFDILPTLLVALSLACLGRRRLVLSAVFLGLATLVKLYPIVLAPLVIRNLAVRGRPAWTWIAAYTLSLAAVLVPTWALLGAQATLAPYLFQLARPPEHGYTIYGHLLPLGLGSSHPWAIIFRLGAIALTLAILFHQRPTDLAGLLGRCTILLVVFVSLPAFFTPQWLLWLTPLVIPLAAADRRMAWAFVALDLLTYLIFPVAYDWGPTQPALLRPVLAIARFASLFAIAVLAWRPRLLTSTAGDRPEIIRVP